MGREVQREGGMTGGLLLRFGVVLSVLIIGTLSVYVTNPIDKCPQVPLHNATSVRDLHPNNIKVYISLGDSITAGFALKGWNTSDILTEYRGESWSSGGDHEATTISNFFRHYTRGLYGQSTGSHLVELPYEDYYVNDVLNAAQSNGGVDTLLWQISHAIKLLKTNPNVNMQKDWKLLNILIGANDACPLCWTFDRPTAQQAGDSYEKYLRAALEDIRTHIPRVFVNILPMFNISQVYYLSLNTNYCDDVHIALPVECTCAFDSDKTNRDYLDSVVQEYDARVYKLEKEIKMKNYSDFIVQTQPFSQFLKIPNVHYLSNLDCFHPSLIAHQQLAIATWNSLLTPVAKKPHHFVPDTPIICPDANSRLYT